ncbi:MAG: slyA [Phenylobacterium sp.]|jgi:MarR family transcriptional regulator for hemolysin|uniref:MarR family winged helix-turn-helix transcriptional regulator n=1 Tax=Phenylobacterium sp. TaxID=1871053 RepID=UPI002601BDC4|nr:MarR family winged helix-turn-helix transcriptional regulator [Phenylobacterium sp.]MDB5428534.1 slyA [Phenylobacterium sp.]MDB5436728.1 slyA [Phenylobacterium sp.]MDB5462870.1 slyA [Phenylobacterium sp.]MDB5496858.1 slyA [Phenylobacterium sp.]
MGPPSDPPLGLLLSQTAKRLSRALDDALAAAGGSLPTWLILMSLMREGKLSHGELAHRVGIRGPTLTHHLDTMADQGLVLRERPPGNRRVQVASLTPAGVAMFHRLRSAAAEHDKRVRSGFSEAETRQMRAFLVRLAKDFAGTIEPQLGAQKEIER